MHDMSGVAAAPTVAPDGDAFHVAGVKRPTASSQCPGHHGRVGHDLAANERENKASADGVVPVILGEPSIERIQDQPAQGL